MSPFRGVTFWSLQMANSVENGMECVEKVEYLIGGDWEAAHRV